MSAPSGDDTAVARRVADKIRPGTYLKWQPKWDDLNRAADLIERLAAECQRAWGVAELAQQRLDAAEVAARSVAALAGSASPSRDEGHQQENERPDDAQIAKLTEQVAKLKASGYEPVISTDESAAVEGHRDTQPEAAEPPADPRCTAKLGKRPYWMGVDQYDPCRCELDAGHAPVEGGERGHWCEHLDVPDPRLAASSEGTATEGETP